MYVLCVSFVCVQGDQIRALDLLELEWQVYYMIAWHPKRSEEGVNPLELEFGQMWATLWLLELESGFATSAALAGMCSVSVQSLPAFWTVVYHHH